MQKCKYVYLKDKSSDNYRLFGELDDASFETDIAGNYRITYEKLKETGPNKIIIGAAATLIAAIVGIYLILRRVL